MARKRAGKSDPNSGLLLEKEVALAVIRARYRLTMAMVTYSIVSTLSGLCLILFTPDSPNTATIRFTRFIEFSASGFGAVIMVVGVMSLLVAHLCRPKLMQSNGRDKTVLTVLVAVAKAIAAVLRPSKRLQPRLTA